MDSYSPDFLGDDGEEITAVRRALDCAGDAQTADPGQPIDIRAQPEILHARRSDTPK
jgi:hypothetical protein